MLRAGLGSFMCRSRLAWTAQQQQQLLPVVSPLSCCVGQQAQQPQPHQQQQVRHHYQIYATKYLDRSEGTGQWKYRDWGDVVTELERACLAPESNMKDLTIEDNERKRFVKPTQHRRHLNSLKVHNRAYKRVTDLIRYVEFVKDN